MRFVKTEALGNDFLLVEEEEVPEGKAPAELARRLCHRLRGVGADGLILFRGVGPAVTMKLLNSDGSDAEISGNGLRCLGAYLWLCGRAEEDRLEITTAAGLRVLEKVEKKGPRFVVASNLGVPRLGSEDIPFLLEPPSRPVVGVPLQLEGQTLPVTVVSMGNPHCVVLVDHLDDDVVRRLGPHIEKHPRFPRRTNVEFVEVESPSRLRIGIWERGAGETAASGTGAAAAAVAAHLNRRAGERVTVVSAGGILEVVWKDSHDVWVTGEAVVVAEGRFLADG